MPESNTAAKPLDFLALRGLPASETEVLQGAGGGALTLSGGAATYIPGRVQPTQPPSKTAIAEEAKLADALWQAQDTLITRQTDYLTNLRKELATKWEDIPAKLKDRTVKETLIEEFAAWLGGKIATYFWGPVAGELAELGITLVAQAIRLLQALYSDGQALCESMAAENGALQALEQTRENYELRSTILTQHDLTVRNLLLEMVETEKTVQASTVVSGGDLKDIAETLKLIQAEDNIVQCPHSGDCLYVKSLVRDWGHT